MIQHFQKRIALPADQSTWLYLLSPLFIGLFAAGSFLAAHLFLIIAALALFLFSKPALLVAKIRSGQHPQDDLPTAGFWAMLYALGLLASFSQLFAMGYGRLFYLALPWLLLLFWRLSSIGKGADTDNPIVEIIYSGTLAAAAPAAYWVGLGAYDDAGWWLWALCWLQSAAAIFYVHLRDEQRQLDQMPPLGERLKMGRCALIITSANLLLVAAMAQLGRLPALLWLPYLLQLLEAVWGTLKPAASAKTETIGRRQLIVGILFTILFIIYWR